MNNYYVILFNSKKKKQESFMTQAENEHDLELALEIFLENGYELVEFEKIDSERT